MSFVPPQMVPPFYGFTDFTPALPEFYWDVYSAEQRIKHICYELQKLVAYSDNLSDNINIDHELIRELQENFQRFMESGFDDYYAEQISQWVMTHMPQIITQAIQMVFFGLNKDGYFTAYSPPQWAIQFDTDVDYSSTTYGCLEILY